MIKLTFFEGEALYLAPEQITAVYDDISATTIDCGAEKYSVEEKPEEVVRKIMDYKMEIMDFQACLNNPEISSMADSVKQLYKLAGLVQSP